MLESTNKNSFCSTCVSNAFISFTKIEKFLLRKRIFSFEFSRIKNDNWIGIYQKKGQSPLHKCWLYASPTAFLPFLVHPSNFARPILLILFSNRNEMRNMKLISWWVAENTKIIFSSPCKFRSFRTSSSRTPSNISKRIFFKRSKNN